MCGYVCKPRGVNFKPMIDYLPDGVHIAIVEHHQVRGGRDDEQCNGMVGDFTPRILSIYDNTEQGHERAQADLDKMLATLATDHISTIKSY